MDVAWGFWFADFPGLESLFLLSWVDLSGNNIKVGNVCEQYELVTYTITELAPSVLCVCGGVWVGGWVYACVCCACVLCMCVCVETVWTEPSGHCRTWCAVTVCAVPKEAGFTLHYRTFRCELCYTSNRSPSSLQLALPFTNVLPSGSKHISDD